MSATAMDDYRKNQTSNEGDLRVFDVRSADEFGVIVPKRDDVVLKKDDCGPNVPRA